MPLYDPASSAYFTSDLLGDARIGTNDNVGTWLEVTGSVSGIMKENEGRRHCNRYLSNSGNFSHIKEG